ncbi:MAG: hypothetical protein LBR08_10985 [Bacteroidales bacterium]|jgi:hypothetical protein|nr:hypothetical protein [Bacteroidales bacterium]
MNENVQIFNSSGNIRGIGIGLFIIGIVAAVVGVLLGYYLHGAYYALGGIALVSISSSGFVIWRNHPAKVLFFYDDHFSYQPGRSNPTVVSYASVSNVTVLPTSVTVEYGNETPRKLVFRKSFFESERWLMMVKRIKALNPKNAQQSDKKLPDGAEADSE